MDILVTATGKEINVSGVTQDNFLQVIHCKVCGMPLTEIVVVFSDSTETQTMTYGDTVFEGYTHLKAISPMSDWVNVMMGRTA